MVRAVARLFLPAAAVLLALQTLPAADAATNRPGDARKKDVATPAGRVASNLETAGALQAATNPGTPAVIRFNSQAADEQAAALQSAVARDVASFSNFNSPTEAELILAPGDSSGADHHASGQVIGRKDETVLDESEGGTGEAEAGKFAAIKRTKTALISGQTSRRLDLWGAAAEIAILLIWELTRRRSRRTRLPAPALAGALAVQSREVSENWRRRALAAEQRADKAQAVIRAGLTSHLAQWMSDSLVQKLLLQRAQLIDVQRKAVSQMDRLEERLETVQTRMQDRLLAYEQRIAELERELDTKDAENRELIKAEIQEIKRRRELERAKNPAELN